jgi:hypothetical protein
MMFVGDTNGTVRAWRIDADRGSMPQAAIKDAAYIDGSLLDFGL